MKDILYQAISVRKAFSQVRNGTFRGGGSEQLLVQLLMAAAIMGWSLLVVLPFFYLLGAVFGHWRDPRRGLRVSAEDEMRGLDEIHHGCEPRSGLLGAKKDILESDMSLEG